MLIALKNPHHLLHLLLSLFRFRVKWLSKLVELHKLYDSRIVCGHQAQLSTPVRPFSDPFPILARPQL